MANNIDIPAFSLCNIKAVNIASSPCGKSTIPFHTVTVHGGERGEG